MNVWQPQKADYLAIINDQNPWHSLKTVPEELARPKNRPLADILWQVLLKPPVRRHQIILGPRRVGKTTVMYQTVGKLLKAGVPPGRLWWLRLDHPLLLNISLGTLVKDIIQATNVASGDPLYLFLDELTYATDWDLWLKTFYDEQWPVRLVGTSSSIAAIRKQGSESGVGRWDEQYLAPYLFTEFLDLHGDFQYRNTVQPQANLAATIDYMVSNARRTPDLSAERRRYIITGGFPELLLQEPSHDEASDLFRSQRILRSDAIEKAIYKDIPQVFNIQDPTKLERFLYSLAGQITGVFSPKTLATDLQMTSKTLEKYVSYFERAFLIFTLPNYSASEGTVQRRGRKLYFVDGAVRNAALLRGIAPLQDPGEMGVLMENLAASHLHALSHQTGVRAYHWRHRKSEVDLVYDHPETPIAFEVGSSRKHPTKGIKEFQNKFPTFRGRCYLVYPGAEYQTPTVDVPGRLPLDSFLIAVGMQTEFALESRVGARKDESGQLLLFEEQ